MMTSFMNWTQPLTERQRMAILYLFEKWARDIEHWKGAFTS